jgi:hypothetical protein
MKIARGALFHIALTIACLTTGLANIAVWRRLELTDVLVVRKVDYNHYPIEYAHQTVIFLIFCAVHQLTGLAARVPGWGTEIAAILLSGFFQNFFMEISLQFFGTRKMDLVHFASRAPSVVVAAIEWMQVHGAVRAATAVAVSWQAFLEGGLYFATLYMLGMWARLARRGDRRAGATLLLAATWMIGFRTGACVWHGWPQPIVAGSAAAGKRNLLSSIAYRVPQLFTVRALLARGHSRFEWLSLAAVQFAFFTCYFFMLRGMGRSYLETSAGEAPHLLADVGFTLFRAFEPVLGGSCTMIVALAMTGRLGAAGRADDAPPSDGARAGKGGKRD